MNTKHRIWRGARWRRRAPCVPGERRRTLRSAYDWPDERRWRESLRSNHRAWGHRAWCASLLVALFGSCAYPSDETHRAGAPSGRGAIHADASGIPPAIAPSRALVSTPRRTLRLRSLSLDVPTELVHVTTGHRAQGPSCEPEPTYESALRVKRGRVPDRTDAVAAALHAALAARGVPSPPQEPEGFDIDGPSVDLGVFGSVREVDQSQCVRTRHGESATMSRVRVDWLVLGHASQQPLLRVTTEGVARDSGADTDPETGLRQALASAALALAADPALVALLAPGTTLEKSAPLERSAFVEKSATRSTPERVGGGFKSELARARDATVAVSTVRGDQSGILIAPGFVVTHADAVLGARIRVRIGTVRHSATLVCDDPVRRVALLRIEGADDTPHASVRPDEPVLGAPVFLATALPDRAERTVSAGIVSARRTHEGTAIYQTDAIAAATSRGGPVVDARGVVIGVVSGGMRAAQGRDLGINYFLPIRDVLRALSIDDPSALADLSPGAAPMGTSR